MKIPILMYHEISPHPDPAYTLYTVTPQVFARQMRLLQRLRFSTIAPDDLLRHVEEGRPLPKRPVMITFDDGYEASVRYGTSILRPRGFTAVYYLVTGAMGGPAAWLPGDLGDRLSLIDWDTARRIEREGFVCGSHTVTHPRLAEVSANVVAGELRESRRVLEEQLGHEVRHLAYPYGSYNPEVRQAAAEAGYATAVSTRPGIASSSENLLELSRIDMGGTRVTLDFLWRLFNVAPLGTRVPERLRPLVHRVVR